jgi:GNAT superfamily N-acetyltransferase
MTIRFERTSGADERSTHLREAMDSETFGLYASEFDSMPVDVRNRTLAALGTDPADLFEVVIAIDDEAIEGEQFVGHAALRRLPDGILEVKKVFVPTWARRRGLSRLLMIEIEGVARELGAETLYLQTGPMQVEALALYADIGYEPVPAYGPYVQLDDPMCFAKKL